MRKILPFLVLIWSGLLRAEPKDGFNRVWPEPPAQARLAYVESISAPEDLGARSSAFSRLGFWLTGNKQAETHFDKPFGVAVDEDGNLLMTDTGSRSVCYFDLRKKAFHQWKEINGIALQSPVAAAKTGDAFFVADSKLGDVLAFNSSGHLLFAAKDHLSRPVGLAVSSGRLFVVDSQLHAVSVFDLAGHFRFQFGKRGAGPGEFNFPTHIAASLDGVLYVTDSMNERVEAFDNAGRYLRAIGDPGDTAGHFSRPKGVAVDSFGRVYVMDAMLDNLQIFGASGEFLLDVGSTGSAPGQFWLPGGIAISRDNTIYIADSYNHRVQVLKYIGP